MPQSTAPHYKVSGQKAEVEQEPRMLELLNFKDLFEEYASFGHVLLAKRLNEQNALRKEIRKDREERQAQVGKKKGK